MDHPQRLIFLILAIGWTLFRLLRYLRAGTSGRPGPAVPPSGDNPPPQPAGVAGAPGAVQSPIGPAGRSARSGALPVAGILIVGNVVIWPLLFATPALEGVPPMVRLVAGVLANLILIGLARGVAARLAQRTPAGARDDRDPIK